MTSKSNEYATLEVKGPGKLPILSTGIVGAKTLRSFKRALRSHFREKKVVEDKEKIQKMMDCCEDANQENWFENNEEALLKKTFDTFFDEFAIHFRDKDWEQKLYNELISSKLGSDQPFFQWATDCQMNNALLKGTNSYHSEEALICLLQANMGEDLRLKTKSCDTKSFKTWLDACSEIDETRARDLQAVKGLISAESRKRSASSVLSGPSRKANTNTSSAGTGDAKPTKKYLPKLTDEERALLKEHQGCRKCRRFYVHHEFNDCPHDYPKPDGYTTLTSEMALAAKAKKSSASNKKGKSVNAVKPASDAGDASDPNSEEEDRPAVSAVLPKAYAGDTTDEDHSA